MAAAASYGLLGIPQTDGEISAFLRSHGFNTNPKTSEAHPPEIIDASLAFTKYVLTELKAHILLQKLRRTHESLQIPSNMKEGRTVDGKTIYGLVARERAICHRIAENFTFCGHKCTAVEFKETIKFTATKTWDFDKDCKCDQSGDPDYFECKCMPKKAKEASDYTPGSYVYYRQHQRTAFGIKFAI